MTVKLLLINFGTYHKLKFLASVLLTKLFIKCYIMIGTKYGRGPQKKTTHSALKVQEGTPEELAFYSRQICSNIGSIQNTLQRYSGLEFRDL